MNDADFLRQWTRGQLLKAYDVLERGGSLVDAAERTGHTAADVDLAMWAVVCTDTVGQALERVNARFLEGQGREGSNVLPLAR